MLGLQQRPTARTTRHTSHCQHGLCVSVRSKSSDLEPAPSEATDHHISHRCWRLAVRVIDERDTRLQFACQQRIPEAQQHIDRVRRGGDASAALTHQLIILDELGFIPFSSAGAQLLFQFCSALHEQVALIVTTNLAFSDWPQVFGDARRSRTRHEGGMTR